MKRLGFGCMRLPMLGGAEGCVDQEQFNRMVDQFLAEGFTYFDTAHGYLNGKSELAIQEGLVKRYPRDRYVLTDKLTENFFQCQEEIIPFFQRQLAACGVDYFDYYLMHALTAESYRKFTDCGAFSVVQQLRAEGKIRHIGISYHDKPALLEQILTEHPEIEVVQIQFNYADYDNPSIESGAVLEVCKKYKKPVFVMEPVKGGGLAELPSEARAILDGLRNGSPASYAIRYAASFEGIVMVLSGMSSEAQMVENLRFMKDFQPLTQAEYAAIDQVKEILKKQNTIPCTGCRYCVAGCPQKILISDLFSCYNTKQIFGGWNSDFYYGVNTTDHGKAGDCIGCKQCERTCPQHLPVTALLAQVADTFETEQAQH
ncbi:MAG: Fe-S oxidoreductase [Oscillospiraceae bacterium]|nr:Fe-S oxidoreductase [Oscillospiraceae bacterium]